MNSSVVRGFLKAVIILGISFMILYYFSYNKWLDHDFNSVDITYKERDYETNDNDNQTGDVKEYKELYNKVNYEFLEANYGEEFYNIYYNNGDFTNDYYIYMGVINIIKNEIRVNCYLEKDITSGELYSSIKSLFGEVTYEDDSFNTENGYLSINYDLTTDIYKVKVNDKCSGFDYSNGGIKNVFNSYKLDGKTLYIYEKALYLDYTKDENGNISFNYHKDIYTESDVLSHSFDSINQNELPTYVYKFSLEDNNYVLKDINKK